MAQRGMMLVLNNDEIAAQDRREAEAEDAINNQHVVEDQLAAHIRHVWKRNHDAKRTAEDRMLRNLRQRNGEYDPDKLAAIRQQGGSEVFMMLTAVKCRAAKSWIRDVLMPAGDRPWDLDPTEEPELPPQVMQQVAAKIEQDAIEFAAQTGYPIDQETMAEVYQQAEKMLRSDLEEQAKQRAERMADTIEDLLEQGGWKNEFDAMISDLVDFPAGILKGPVVRRSKQLSWGQGGVPEVTEELRPELERVSPFDIYPEYGAEDVDDGDLIQRHRLTPSELYDLIGVPGYEEDEIREVLREYRQGGLNEWMARAVDESEARANDEQGTGAHQGNYIDALEFWGSVQGSMLIDWGMDADEVGDPEREIDVCVWLVGRHVIKADFNPDPLGRKPYSKACFENVPGSFWGRGVPDLIADCQAVCNAAARAVVNNMGIASGPQVAVDTEALPPGEDVTEMYPWKLWQLQFKDGQGGGRSAPIHFFQPQSLAQELLAVYDKFSQMADEHSGIPAYTYGGSNVGGGGSTASGLSMLMNAASKAIKNVVSHLDSGVIVPTVKRYFEWVMRYHPNQEIKGDATVIARGAMAMVAKEQVQMRRQEYLQMTANPMDAQIIGPQERAELHRELWKGLDMPPDVLPDREEMQQRQAMANQPPPEQGPPGGPDAREALPDGSPAGGQIA